MFVKAVVLGVTQGITEFLPISSDGHLILIPSWLGWARFGLGFDVALHAGTLLATVAFFRADLVRMARALVSSAEEHSADRRLALLVLGATVPSVAIALAFEPLVERVETLAPSSQLTIVAVFLLITAATLAAAEVLGARVPTASRERGPLTDLSWRSALAIGVAQGFAVAPGLSRSGTTIATGVALGMDREQAARFSFLLSVPIVTAATGKKVLLDVIVGGEALPPLAVTLTGIVVTALVGYAAIGFLLPYVRRHSLAPFAAYTALVGAGILLMKMVSG